MRCAILTNQSQPFAFFCVSFSPTQQFMDEVAPNIWLGQFQSVFDDQMPTLKKHKISHIVSIGLFFTCPLLFLLLPLYVWPSSTRHCTLRAQTFFSRLAPLSLQKHKTQNKKGCFQEWWQFRREPKHMLLPLEDTPFVFITDYFAKVFRFMNEALEAGNGVVVHCEQGRSRSGALVIAFLMKRNKTKYPETLNKILLHRKRVMPNIGFQIQVTLFFSPSLFLPFSFSPLLFFFVPCLSLLQPSLSHTLYHSYGHLERTGGIQV